MFFIFYILTKKPQGVVIMPVIIYFISYFEAGKEFCNGYCPDRDKLITTSAAIAVHVSNFPKTVEELANFDN